MVLAISDVLLDPDPAVEGDLKLDCLAGANNDDRFRRGLDTSWQFALAQVKCPRAGEVGQFRILWLSTERHSKNQGDWN